MAGVLSAEAELEAEEQWKQALSAGHPQLDASTKMMTCHWVIDLPLAAEQGSDLEGSYCSAVLFAIHWAGGPGTPATAFALGVPAAACAGIESSTEIVEVPLQFPGAGGEEESGDPALVGILFFEGSELGRLQEGIPSDALMIAFDTLFPDGLPSVPALFASVQEWGELHAPTTLTLEYISGLPYIVRGFQRRSVAPEEEGYHSLTEISPPLAIDQLRVATLPMLADDESGGAAAPVQSSRRVPGTPIVHTAPGPSVAQQTHAPGGTQRKAAAAALSQPGLRGKASASGVARPPPTRKSPRAKADPLILQQQQGEILDVLNNIRSRLVTLEAGATATPAVPLADMPSMPSMPSQVPSLLEPMRGAPGLAVGALRPPSVTGRVGGEASTAHGGGAYQAMLAQARQSLHVPQAATTIPRLVGGGAAAAAPTAGFGPPEMPGPPGRQRGVDQAVRDAILGGGGDASAALQLATLEVLERLASKGERKEPETLEEYLWSSGAGGGRQEVGEDTPASGSRGLQQLLRLQRSQVLHPTQWSTLADIAASRATGSATTGLPWSMELYGQQRLSFSQKQGDLHRCWIMLCALHTLSRQGDTHALDLKITQCLKATEQAVLQHSWEVAWLLTGLPEPTPHGIGSPGLSHPQEMAAAVQQIKERRSLESALKKTEGADQGSEGAGGNTGRRRFPKGGPPPPHKAAQQTPQTTPGQQGQSSGGK
eukprot:6492761-Amphidinium_carterae.2